MKKLLAIISISLLFASCGEYQNLLKSTDAELKYSKAIEYFNKKDFMRASTLLDDVSNYYKGTEKSESVLYYLTESYIGQKDYATAVEYIKTYLKTYPKGPHSGEMRYLTGFCYYKDSPDARLDQEASFNAVNALQEFVDNFPENEKVPEANKLMDELKNKLAYKQYLNAQLYYNLGDYLGNNNFESAVITAQNALKDYPSNSYREQISLLILEAKYQQAFQSVQEKKVDRYRNTIDEYYNYINEFPDGKLRKQADKIFAECKKVIKD